MYVNEKGQKAVEPAALLCDVPDDYPCIGICTGDTAQRHYLINRAGLSGCEADRGHQFCQRHCGFYQRRSGILQRQANVRF